MKYAFVSYSYRDADSVMPIVEALADQGFKVWMDRMELLPGEDWSSSIANAVRDARVLLWFAGRHTATSSWMQEELSAMVRSGEEAIVIPILVHGAEPEALPLFLRERQWVDARSDVGEAIRKLVAALEQYLGPPDITSKTHEYFSKRIPLNKGYVFISYSIENKSFLDKLKRFLREKKYGYWDFHESKRDYQAQFHLELESIIRDSRAVLCIITPAWKASRWAPREYLFSEDIRKPIFLLRAERLEPTLLIAGSSYIDFVEGENQAFAELNRELMTAGL
jgi:TIR domain